MRVAIIGAGMSGLSCARALSAEGASVTVFDKGRGPAGRISTRRAAVPFDHGAQYFTTRDEAFQAEVARLMLDNVVAEWSPRIVAIDQVGGAARPSSDLPRFVGVPGMSAVAQALASTLDVQVNTTVTAIERLDDGWQLKASGEDLPGRFDAVVLTAPPVQTATLLGAHPLAARVGAARMGPCWAVMTSWADAVDVPYDAAFVNEGPLAWIARDGSKPGRPHPHTWVLHASPTWSTEHLEKTPDEVVPLLLEAFEAIVRRPLPTLAFSTAHRWRYAYVAAMIEAPFLWDATSRVGAAGDWCRAPRVEGAWLSGRALAHAMLAS